MAGSRMNVESQDKRPQVLGNHRVSWIFDMITPEVHTLVRDPGYSDVRSVVPKTERLQRLQEIGGTGACPRSPGMWPPPSPGDQLR
jgi:hypothetical protein